tara:strand:+ start:93 stop:356 length:264 start_codon:yes stop_codon:yes gene_type:complete
LKIVGEQKDYKGKSTGAYRRTDTMSEQPNKSILNMYQDYEQVQYLLETNDKLKINLVLDVLSYLDASELKLVKSLIDIRIAVLKGDN